jgi:hypothetical protein
LHLISSKKIINQEGMPMRFINMNKGITYLWIPILVLLFASQAPASVVYHYEGPNFGYVNGSLSESNHLTIDFTTVLPLTSYARPDTPDDPIQAGWTNLTISDGLGKIDVTHATPQYPGIYGNWKNTAVRIYSDFYGGLPTMWIISAEGAGMSVYSEYLDGYFDYVDHSDGSFGYADASGRQGCWTMVSVPEPPTILLFGLSLIGLSLVKFRMKRTSA